MLRDARGRLALRDTRDERHRALRRAHVLQRHGAASDGARHRGRDRRDRRRVQRLHGQGVHGLLRPLRDRVPRHRPRRPRRHDPQRQVRRRGDRAREGRDHRGDEHVHRHAAGLHLARVRPARLRRGAARLEHPRLEGDDPGRLARDVPRLRRPLVLARANGRRARRQPRREAGREGHGTARRPARRVDRLATSVALRGQRADPRAREGVRPGASLPRCRRLPDPASRPLRRRAAAHRARRRHVLAPVHRGAGAPRPRLLRLRRQPGVHRLGHALLAGWRRPEADRRGGDDDPRRAAQDRGRAGACGGAREGAVVRQGPLRPVAGEPAGHEHVRACVARCSRGTRRSRPRCSPSSTR